MHVVQPKCIGTKLANRFAIHLVLGIVIELEELPKRHFGVDLKLVRETLSLALPSSGMRPAFRWRPAFTKALTASATI